MIAVPPRWTHVSAHPEKLALVPRDDPQAAIVTYHERLQPIGRLSELLDRVPLPPGFKITSVTAPELLSTWEGEHACFVVLEGEGDGRAQELVVGFVYLDDYYARIVAYASRAADTARTRADARAMLVGDTHFLGRQRRRRYLYDAPPAWQGRTTTFEAQFYPMDYPRHPSVITVFPALPVSVEPDMDALVRCAGGGHADLERWQPIETREGLSGDCWRDADHATTLVVLVRDGFAYMARLDSQLGAWIVSDLDALLALARSIRPLPRPTRAPLAVNLDRVPSARAAFLHWAE